MLPSPRKKSVINTEAVKVVNEKKEVIDDSNINLPAKNA